MPWLRNSVAGISDHARGTYGNVIGVKSMAETKGITQYGRGDESSVQIELSATFLLLLLQDSVHMKVLGLYQRAGVEEKENSWSNQTSRIPTATQTRTFAKISREMIATAGNGNFRSPGTRP